MKKSYTIARILSFIFSTIMAYFLWTYLRPRFVTPTPIQPIEQITQETLLNGTTTADEAPIATTTALTTPTTVTTQTPSSSKKDLTAPTAILKPQSTPNLQLINKDPSTPKMTKTVPTTRTVTVYNGIEKNMLGYKKFGTHYPTTFKITVGNSVVKQGDKVSAPIKDNTLIMRYDFEFMNGYRNGAREVTIDLKPDTNTITLAFNWKQKQHLAIAEVDRVVSMVEKDVPYQA